MKRIFACTFACLLLAGCVELVVAAGIVTAAGTALNTVADVAPAVIKARNAIKEEKGIAAKLRMFKKRYCDEEALRALTGENLTKLLTQAGVNAVKAVENAFAVKRWSDRLCGGRT